MIVVWILTGVVVAAIAFLGLCAVRMAGLVAREERAALIPQSQNESSEKER